MFGYVRPAADRLTQEQTDLFRSAYCGLCRTLGRRYGLPARIILNYDLAFLAILLAGGSGFSCARHRCPVHPIRGCPCGEENPALDAAADLRDSGATLEETARWVLENRNKVHHQFFSSNMTQFRRTGRVSGTAAMVATIMNICPIMRLDDKGAIKAYSKVRGKKKAVETTVNAMEQHAQGGRDYDQRCFVCHSQCPEDAALLITALEERFPHLKGKIRLCDIGTIIGSHSGPGTVAVFFLGDERPTMD